MADAITTTSGRVELERGLPATAKDSQALYDELDFQRATQAYLWALPIVSVAQWQHEHETIFGAKDGALVAYVTYRDRLGILTANATTPYILTFANLVRTGPLVVESPAGPTAAGIRDFWQRPITDIGQTGPDKGKGGKYLILGPGEKPPDAPATAGERYFTVHSPTVNIMIGFRALDPDPTRAKELIEKVRIYPFVHRDAPAKARLIPAEGRRFYQGQPRGIAYWERLHAILQVEPVEGRDRMMMAMLVPLGIQKGKPFRPDERQKHLLIRGAELGELMAMNFSFNKRFPGAQYRPDTRWNYVMTMDPDQESPFFTELDQRSAWFYEAVTATEGMKSHTAGVGLAYLGAYHDAHGSWLDGGRSYVLHVPPNPPAKQFWSLTVYDTRTRALIDNPQGVADRSSRMDLLANADGSIDLYMGPSAPAGREKNWIPTTAGNTWFAYFRLYGPTERYLDASWKLPDIEPLRSRTMPVTAPSEARSIAKDAWVYAFPMLENYRTMYEHLGDPNAPTAIRGGFGHFRHHSTPFTPDDHDIVTPNNDTPYSWAWLDLRAEPWVLSVPRVPDGRYYVSQWVDLFTYNFAYVGSRATGNGAGSYLIAGPGWAGERPPGISEVFRSETEIVMTLTRVALDGPADVPNVKAVQAGLKLQPLSSFLSSTAPARAPSIILPPYDEEGARSHDFIGYLNFLLQFTQPPVPSEHALMDRFAQIGIGPGLPFDASKLDPSLLAAICGGVADAKTSFAEVAKTTLSSNGIFGTRAFMGNDYMMRAVAAAKGLYGNSIEEAWYGGHVGDGTTLSTLHFAPGELPPASFFWSITLYTLPDRLLFANPLDRYSIGDRTKGLKRDADGGLTLYLGHASPGEDKESNWLPAPAGPYSVVARIYGPDEAAMTGRWTLPALEPADPRRR